MIHGLSDQSPHKSNTCHLKNSHSTQKMYFKSILQRTFLDTRLGITELTNLTGYLPVKLRN